MTNTEAKQLHQESLSKRTALLKKDPKANVRELDRLISVLGQVWNDRISRKAQKALEVL